MEWARILVIKLQVGRMKYLNPYSMVWVVTKSVTSFLGQDPKMACTWNRILFQTQREKLSSLRVYRLWKDAQEIDSMEAIRSRNFQYHSVARNVHYRVWVRGRKRKGEYNSPFAVRAIERSNLMIFESWRSNIVPEDCWKLLTSYFILMPISFVRKPTNNVIICTNRNHIFVNQ